MVDNFGLFLASRRRRGGHNPKSDWDFPFDKGLQRLNKQLDILHIRNIKRYNGIVDVASDGRQLPGERSLQKLCIY